MRLALYLALLKTAGLVDLARIQLPNSLTLLVLKLTVLLCLFVQLANE